MGALGILALPPPPVPMNPDLEGSFSTVSMMTRADALRLRGVYGILDAI